ncbi:MAG: GNAT family N-acetyltransferase [Betaproteobacteria bacterium]|nr:GNAT family N-acetyltransferase [Betaproteobacteria bacterium]
MNAIRTATSKDVPAIVEVTNRAYLAEAACIDGARTDSSDIAAKMRAGDFLLLADAEGALTGSVYAASVRGRGYLGLLAVSPAAQGQGLARVLIHAAEDWCRARQCRYLDLTVINVRHELFPFYRHFGFAPRESVPFPRPDVMKVQLHLVKFTKALYPPEQL